MPRFERYNIGVLGIQGAYLKHAEMIDHLGMNPVIIKYSHQLDNIHGLIIPGGESTTITRVLDFRLNFNDLLKFGRQKPVFGTCAGLILLGHSANDARVRQFDLIDANVSRNAYGSQIESFTDEITLSFSPQIPLHAVFIRAPIVLSIGPDINVLAEQNHKPVLIENNLHLGASFHPELTDDIRVHEYFINKIKGIQHVISQSEI